MQAFRRRFQRVVRIARIVSVGLFLIGATTSAEAQYRKNNTYVFSRGTVQAPRSVPRPVMQYNPAMRSASPQQRAAPNFTRNPQPNFVRPMPGSTPMIAQSAPRPVYPQISGRGYRFTDRSRAAAIASMEAYRQQSLTQDRIDRQLKRTQRLVQGSAMAGGALAGGVPGAGIVGSFIAKQGASQAGKAAGNYIFRSWQRNYPKGIGN